MLFNSFEFLVFFTATVCVFFSLPHKFRQLFLMGAGWYFYAAWNFKYLLLLLFSTSLDFFAAILIEKSNKKTTRLALLLASLISNLGILFAFKYFNFFVQIYNRFAENQDIAFLDVLLPIGISFYTFQTLSYIIDVYKRKIKAESNFISFSLYVSYFPQLVAGPIERAESLMPQLKERQFIKTENLRAGFKLMLWGYFQKLVVADNAALFAELKYLWIFRVILQLLLVLQELWV